MLKQVSLTYVKIRSGSDAMHVSHKNRTIHVTHGCEKGWETTPIILSKRGDRVSSKTIDAIIAVQSAGGSNAKKKVIESNKNDPEFCKILYYLLHPLLTYKVSEKTLRKQTGENISIDDSMSDIFKICSVLSKRKAIDDITVRKVQAFLWSVQEKDRDVYIGLLSKTLRLGVTAKTVNKVIPGLIPEWEVQQAYPIDKYPIRQGTWFSLTQKLNGIRATFYQGNLYARSGEQFSGLDHIAEKLSEYSDKYVFDGELTLCDTDNLSDNEKFRIATGIVNSDSEDKSMICYTVFDALPVVEFDLGVSMDGYKARREFLNSISSSIESEKVKVLETLYEGYDQSKIDEYLEQMVREDKEGLMVNLDVPYQCKRHKGILKVKRFYTMDLPIIRCEEGSGRLAGTLGALVLDYKGNEVKVGSGFTDEQRSDCWENRENLPGILCEVKYKEISSDKHTKAESLQFPVFITLRTDKSEVNYE